MTEELFWKIIEETKSSTQDEHADQIVAQLTQLSIDDINNFEKELRKRIAEADDYRVMALAKIIDGYVSDDSYLYFRCWLIGKGKAIFYKILANPDDLIDYVIPSELPDFESLLYVATTAVEEISDEEDFEDPRDIAVEDGLDYDSDGNTKGEDWNEEDLPKLYPKLWAAFGGN
ncbi:DUF4240 domain-containing protein [Sphingobacterium sp. LRF_L2]|uniref:DUF4240 domain-containing protein n=1 Tax=Sphingobacterium sp. LRF_L2 TaxID=3369421 RepID=UPI003F6345AB